ncbi:acyltransferase family protein [Chondrinema litorale]|uniref:acyltransferase family protein n=1 Tax=Chondrinema litorale TaxID=2994555 RepID=UPI0025432B8F|nr:acyltransferase [Chondrinema litorale]UZS00145.1 acyltransferase [Chondrinema litorale]
MIPALNGFRFILFFIVYLYHIKVLEGGYIGVQGFFVLSGFLLTPILVNTKKNTNTLFEYLKNFLVRRSLRIFPLYYLYLGVIFITIIAFNLDSSPYFESLKSQLIFGLSYTYNFYHQTAFWEHNVFIVHFWSLAVEEQFYLFWPLLIYLFPSRRLSFILIVIIALGPILRFFLASISDMNIFTFLIDNRNIFVYLSTISHIDAFAIGGLFATNKSLSINIKYLILILILVLTLGYITNIISTNSINWSSLGYPEYMTNSYKFIWGYSLVNLCFAGIILNIKNGGLFSSFLKNKQLTLLGKISYGLYVYHYGAIYCAGFVQKKLENYVPDWLLDTRIIAFIITVIISYVSYFYFEERFIKLKDKIAPKKK